MSHSAVWFEYKFDITVMGIFFVSYVDFSPESAGKGFRFNEVTMEIAIWNVE